MTQPKINNVEVCPGCGKPYHSLSREYNTVTDDQTGITWHKLCYDLRDVSYKAIVAVAEETYGEDDWRLAIFEYLYSRIVLPNADWPRITRQMQQYKAEGHSFKAIYYALVYTYFVKKCDPIKANGGIGILSYMWEESSAYWNSYLTETIKRKKEIEEEAKRQAQLASRKLTTRKKETKPKRDIAGAFAAMMKGEDNE